MGKDLLFISWTSRDGIGEELGKYFQVFFRSVFGNVLDTFFSKKDMIGHTDGWQSTLTKDKLSKTKYGIFLLSQDAINSEWVNFELGAIVANNVKTIKDSENRRIFPIRFTNELDKSKSPFNIYQIVDFTRDNIWEIVKLIAFEYPQLGNLKDIFETQWPILEKQVSKIQKRVNEPHNNSHPFFEDVKDYLYLVLEAETDNDDIFFIPSFLYDLYDENFKEKFSQTIDFLYDKKVISSNQPTKIVNQAYKPGHNEFYLNYKEMSFQIKIQPACRITIDGYMLSKEGADYYKNTYKKANSDVMSNYQSALQVYLADKAIISTLKN